MLYAGATLRYSHHVYPLVNQSYPTYRKRHLPPVLRGNSHGLRIEKSYHQANRHRTSRGSPQAMRNDLPVGIDLGSILGASAKQN